MIKGYFDGNVPMVSVIVGSGQTTQIPFVILDTGFTGDLQITPQLAKELGLTVTSAEKMKVADGRIITIPTAFAFVELEGIKKYVHVLISESMSLAILSAFLS